MRCEIQNKQVRIMAELTNADPCVHALLDNGIHEFVFYESSRQAVDRLFAQLTQLYDGLTTDQPVPLLFDVREHDLPLAYLFMTFQKWTAGRKQHRPARLAILTDEHTLVPLVDAFLRTLRTTYLKARFFARPQRDEAVDWLVYDR